MRVKTSSRNKVQFLLLIILSFNLFAFSFSQFNIKMGDQTNQIFNLKNSGYWINTSLTIDDNALINTTNSGDWAWAVKQPWCYGLGTYSNPYVIENLTLTIGTAEYGLAIKNSRNAFFELINVSGHGAIDENYKGLFITNSTNGVIRNCNFSSNYYGIYMYNNCDNFTIIRNDVSRCTSGSASPIYTPKGIFLEDDCDFNLLLNNTANQGGSRMDDGIYLLDYCDNNTIINNELVGVDISSVYLENYCNNNTIRNNTLTGSLYGVDMLDFCSNNEISDNKGNFNSYGIRMRDDCSNNKILNNTFKYSSSRGIGLDYAYNNTIVYNELISTGYYGIDISYYSNNNEIKNNTIEDVSHGGINLIGSSDNNVYNNTMLGCGIYVSGSTVDRVSNHIFTSNTANGKPIYYYINEDGLNSADFATPGQIILVNCTDSDILSFSFDHVSVGIQLLFTSNSRVLLNTIVDCTSGYFQHGGEKNTIVWNDFSNNIAGIAIENTKFNNISHNTVNSNGNYGIWIGMYAHNNTIHDNLGFSNGLGGLNIQYSENNSCYNNTFSGSSRGIELISSAQNNRIFNNQIWNVQFGFLLQLGCHYNIFAGNNITGAFSSGVQISSSNYNLFMNNIIMSSGGTGFYISNSNSNNNTISQNAFLSNNVQGQDLGTGTKWTKNSLGNYWDDYNGIDSNSDGIGDTPYFIPPNGVDDRPLMSWPFVGPAPVLPDLIIYNYTLTNDSLTLVIKNNGDENATGAVVYVQINSILLTLYNNSLTPVDLDINETFLVSVNFTDFESYFSAGENYTIDINVDPANLIVEGDELNNNLRLNYSYPFSQEEPKYLPDLLFETYLLTNESLTLYLKNNGTHNATGIIIVAQIASIPIILYNNTLAPVFLDINETYIIFINLTFFFQYFTVNTDYIINVEADPFNQIIEVEEINNALNIPYTYYPQDQNGDLPYVPTTIGWDSTILVIGITISITLFSIYVKSKNRKFLLKK